MGKSRRSCQSLKSCDRHADQISNHDSTSRHIRSWSGAECRYPAASRSSSSESASTARLMSSPAQMRADFCGHLAEDANQFQCGSTAGDDTGNIAVTRCSSDAISCGSFFAPAQRSSIGYLPWAATTHRQRRSLRQGNSIPSTKRSDDPNPVSGVIAASRLT